MLFVAHEGQRDGEADEGGVDGVACEYESHTDLRLVALVEDVRLGRHLYLVLDAQELVEDQAVCKHDE